MIRKIYIPGTINGADFKLQVVYDYDPGQPWTLDCAPLSENIEIIEMSIASKSRNNNLIFNPDQHYALLETCEDAILEACLRDAAEILWEEGWIYDQHYKTWKKPPYLRRNCI